MSLAVNTKRWLQRHTPSLAHRAAVLRRKWMRACWRAQGMMSYSQFGEDVEAIRYFGQKQGGVYVDIGAYDGIHLSNTAMLEMQYGWRGVLVEPIKEAFDRMVGARPRSVCVNGAVSAKEGPLRLTYSAADGGMLSGTEYDPRHRARLEEESLRQQASIEVRLVPAIHPNDVLKAAAVLAETGPSVKAIDFLSIDTEGTELDILKAIDWKTYRPKLLCIENHFQERHQADFLHTVGYRRTGRTLGHSNDFYADAE